MAPRRRRKGQLSGITAILAGVVVVFCILSSLQEKNGIDLGLPAVRLPSLSFLFDSLEAVTENNAESEDDALPVSGGNASGTLEVHYLNMGQADSILIKGPEKSVLIDAGENNQGDQVLRYLREQGVHRIDLLIATHPHSDHIGGMDTVILGMDVELILMPDLPEDILPTTVTYTDLLEAILQKEVHTVYAEPGERYDLGGGALLTIVGPVSAYKDLNNMSVVSRLTYGKHSFLFTGDCSAESERDLLDSGGHLQANVLDVGHHGSNSSTTVEFLAAVQPDIALIACGLDNSYGHPHRDVVERLQNQGIQIIRTDLNGEIILRSDGDSLEIETAA